MEDKQNITHILLYPLIVITSMKRFELAFPQTTILFPAYHHLFSLSFMDKFLNSDSTF